MKPDIISSSDVKCIVDNFYDAVKTDDVIGYIFNDVVKVNWATHLPVIYSFWESVLFGTMTYRGNPMLKHLDLNKTVPLTEEHFARWFELWSQTINTHFTGVKADEAKSRANSMRLLMLLKIQRGF